MGLLNRKPKLSIEECCRQFYDKGIFHSIIAGTDVWSGLLDTYFESVAEADQSFLSIDPTLFRNEMTALRMELFALAWSQRFKSEKYTIPQSFFTRSYLEENGRLDIWDIMLEYNLFVATSATTTESGEDMDDKYIAQINKLRSDFGEKWVKANINPIPVNMDDMTQEQQAKFTSACRVANRIGADFRQARGVAVKLLTVKLENRLGYEENLKSEAVLRLVAIIVGFFNGAEEYLESVDLQVGELPRS